MHSLIQFSASMGSQYGGTETYVQTLTRQVANSIPDVRLITGGPEKNFTKDYKSLLALDNCTHLSVPILGRHSLMGRLLARTWLGTKLGPLDLESLSALLFVHKIRSFVTQRQVLEAHYPLDGLMFPLLPTGIKKILHFHGACLPPLYRKCWPFILRHTHCCIACSNYAREELLKEMPTASIKVLYNGVDPQTFHPGTSTFEPGCQYDRQKLRIGIAARLSPDKGVDILCELAPKLHDIAEIFLAGPVAPHFSTQLDTAATCKNLHVLGPIEHQVIPEFYRFIDIFVLPSRFEAFPITVLEAMASGCGVIATRVGGIPEMIGQEEQAGFLIEAGDSNNLLTLLHKFYQNPSLYQKRADMGRQRVMDTFSLEKTATRALNLYEGLLADQDEVLDRRRRHLAP
ncbi:MAG: hypothetical protein CSA33_02180 [Desulfobulbus propionicus]|nr:MAG: hypothetical protein CSA33_02180 [Desulfobulbus propionicus]